MNKRGEFLTFINKEWHEKNRGKNFFFNFGQIKTNETMSFKIFYYEDSSEKLIKCLLDFDCKNKIIKIINKNNETVGIIPFEYAKLFEKTIEKMESFFKEAKKDDNEKES